jgi:protein-disulfide isomerase
MAKGEDAKNEASSDVVLKLRTNPWIASTILLAVVLLVVLVFRIPNLTGNVVKTDVIEKNLLGFIASQGSGSNASVVDTVREGQFYKVTVEYNGQEIPVYVTTDGKYLISQLIPLNATTTAAPAEEAPAEVPKFDKPVAELFVMTYCPYGTQAEKGLIPALKTLGTKINGKIRFVHYFMHGDKEEQETYTQVCLREEQSNKFIPYLECFLSDSNSSRCLVSVVADKAKLADCLVNRSKEYYAQDSELSNKYGVGGSPTLVINGIQSDAGRSPASYLAGICAGFKDAPADCGKEVSSVTPSPGFGYTQTAAASSGSANDAAAAASCG